MQETKRQLLNGMRNAGWGSEEVTQMKQAIGEDAKVLSANVDRDYVEVIVDDGRKLELFRKE